MKLLYRLLTGSSHFSKLTQFVKFSNSNRRPMILVRKDTCTSHFFAKSIPIWNNLVKNIPVFLSPYQFSNFLDLNIPRY
nr:protein C17B7.6 [imported] - Caenorhabditis elegans [Caenorhabditis elegans]